MLTSFIIDQIILVSASEKKLADKIGIWKKDKLKVINNGIYSPILDLNAKEVQKLINYKTKNNFDSIIINLSRFNYQKNHEEILKISKLIPKSLFCIVGNGEGYLRFKKLIQTEKLKNIYLPGFIENTSNLISVSDIYLSTSRWEGMPLSLIEAMSLEKPVVASDVVGNTDLVKHTETGYLYSIGKINDAITFINEILKNPDKKTRLGNEAKKIQIENFSIEQMLKNTKKLYNKILFT